jgi:hypothetical protein
MTAMLLAFIAGFISGAFVMAAACLYLLKHGMGA